MRNLFILLIIVFYYQLYAQTSVGGTYTSDVTWTLANSPYSLTSDVKISGANLTIESGVVVQLNNYSISILSKETYSSGQYYYYTSSISADNVTFKSSTTSTYSKYISFGGEYDDNTSTIYYAGGTLNNCSFENVKIYSGSYSNPTISNSTFNTNLTNEKNNGMAIQLYRKDCISAITGNTINDYYYALGLYDGAKPTISANNTSNCVTNYIALGGGFPKDYELSDYGYPYQLTKDLSCTSFTFAPGLVIDLKTSDISIGTGWDYSSEFNAENVTFKSTASNTYSREISYSGRYDGNTSTARYVGGTLNNCTFNNVKFYFDAYSNPTISNSTISTQLTKEKNEGIALNADDSSIPTFSGNTISDYYYAFGIYDGANPTVSSNNITNCGSNHIALGGSFPNNYQLSGYGYPYQLTRDLSCSSFSFTSGIIIDLKNSDITISSGKYYAVELNADNVTFKSSTTSTYSKYISFGGEYDDNTSTIYYAGGTLNNCSFENVKIYSGSYSNPTISNSTFTTNLNNEKNSGIALNTGYRSSNAVPVFTGNTINDYCLGSVGNGLFATKLR